MTLTGMGLGLLTTGQNNKGNPHTIIKKEDIYTFDQNQERQGMN